MSTYKTRLFKLSLKEDRGVPIRGDQLRLLETLTIKQKRNAKVSKVNTIGSSMQDISRDDFSLLSGSTSGVGIGCDKDVHITQTSSPIPTTPPPSIPEGSYQHCTDIGPVSSPYSSNLDRVNTKIEESCSDLYETTPPSSWHHPHHHHHHHHPRHTADIGSSKLLLKNSDDPLISRGASAVEGDDDNPTELNSIVAAAAGVAKQQKMTPSAIHTSDQATNSPKRNKNASNPPSTRARRKGTFKLRFHHQALPPEYLSHYEASLNQQQKNNNNNNNTINSNKSKKQIDHHHDGDKLKSGTNSHETVRSWLQQISDSQSMHSLAENRVEGQDEASTPVVAQQSPKRVVNYSDLPYMGEMTLENTKPRRGRKPKKADICHLIFKNYGTIFPGTPKDRVEEETKCLLEKRLKEQSQSVANPNQNHTEQPLNLCLRDQSTDSLTISSDDDSSDEVIQSNRTTPITTPSDAVTDAILAANLKMSLPNFQSALLDKNSEENQTPSTGDSEKTSSSNYPYWPGSGNVFVHPMALYYQKMVDARFQPSSGQRASPSSGREPEGSPKIFPKHLSQLIKKEKTEPPEPCSTPSSIKSNSSSTTGTMSSSHKRGMAPPQKRKRSAIFIPPIPAENTTNPATEVSICKFKFTGGAKPSLQEKKMLSVDSDGNYRYYSGTGDKSMRGYEFFPRESLQQSGLIPGMNSATAFLNATGEKISQDLPPPSTGLSNELLHIPDSPPGGMILPPSHNSKSQNQNFKVRPNSNPAPGSTCPSTSQLAKEKRKRKSRRSIQREKLEQTFKEKGFLIQTQQLESAEGATYCKFRQLRKFTRYLFRSWKDHLPGELQHTNPANAAAAAAAMMIPSGKQSSALQKSLMATSSVQQIGEKAQRN